MRDQSNVQLKINFNDPDFDAEERDEEVQKLLEQMQDMDEVEVKRVPDPNPPQGNKAIGSFLVGLLMAEVNAANFKAVMGFLGDRLSGKMIELEVEANGKRLAVKASSREELELAIKKAQEFITG